MGKGGGGGGGEKVKWKGKRRERIETVMEEEMHRSEEELYVASVSAFWWYCM